VVDALPSLLEGIAVAEGTTAAGSAPGASFCAERACGPTPSAAPVLAALGISVGLVIAGSFLTARWSRSRGGRAR
jgi:hypothetical protein